MPEYFSNQSLDTLFQNRPIGSASSSIFIKLGRNFMHISENLAKFLVSLRFESKQNVNKAHLYVTSTLAKRKSTKTKNQERS